MDTRTGIVQVAYHQYYLRDLGMVAEVPDEVFTGGNGLISTPPGIAGIAVVHAGTHTGPVRVTVQARTDPPPHTDLEQWEEVVEVSITTQAGQVLVEEWAARPATISAISWRPARAATGSACTPAAATGPTATSSLPGTPSRSTCSSPGPPRPPTRRP
jgi:hypothetical protein